MDGFGFIVFLIGKGKTFRCSDISDFSRSPEDEGWLVSKLFEIRASGNKQLFV
jgi:hypothetical protein